jgi:hypothetical protein
LVSCFQAAAGAWEGTTGALQVLFAGALKKREVALGPFFYTKVHTAVLKAILVKKLERLGYRVTLSDHAATAAAS